MIKLEKKIEETLEDYLTVDYYKSEPIEKEAPLSLIMDVSDFTPGEIEIEDEIKRGYLWKKYHKKSK
jgi:hypothetical protein